MTTIRKKKRYLSLFLLMCMLLSLLSGCSKKDATGTYALNRYGEAILNDDFLQPVFTTDDNYRVFYEIFVGSFADSDGDGIGDLRGIIEHMDYLNDGDPSSGCSLGIEGIWLTPIFRSLSYHKYDIDDYYEIDKDFGTMEDLKELIELCHERNVLLILDLPINHTGINNAWYSKFRMAHMKEDPSDPYYDFYSWSNKDSIPSGKTYHPVNGTDIYVEGNFSDVMPEPDFDNSFVRDTMLDIARYYLDLGVDGFRFDAAKYIYYGETEPNVEFWKWYVGNLKAIKPDIYTVAEVWDSDSMTDRYYPALNCFNFQASQVSGLIADTAQRGNVNRLTSYTESYLHNITSLREDAMMLLFLTNHDMDRAAGFLTEASGYMRMAANLYLLGPGSPFIYYGEELGMRGSRGGSNTDANRRLAFPWGDYTASGANGNHATADNPEGTTYDSEKQIQSTAYDQMGDAGSLYSYYKKLIMLRNANPEIARGEYTALNFTDTSVGGFISTFNDSSVLVLHNTTSHEVTIDLADVTDMNFSKITAMIGVEGMMDSDGVIIHIYSEMDGTKVTLSPQTSVILR